MEESANKLALIRPELLGGLDRVGAFFTLKNEDRVMDKGDIPGLNLGLNTGASKRVVHEHRTRLLSELGIAPDRIAYADQVHGSRVRFVTEGGTYPETDALVTQIPELALAIQVADCAAVLLADPKARVIGAVHAGWRGAAGDIVPGAINMMQSLGADPGEVRAFISPCISLKNFEVGQDVAEHFPDEFVDYRHYEKPHVNLKGFLKRQMVEAGLEGNHIEIHEGCTVDAEDAYYSYRREGDRSGRMLGIVKLELNS